MSPLKIVYEVTSFEVSDAFLQHPESFEPAASLITQNAPHGCVVLETRCLVWRAHAYVRNYAGLQVEEPTNRLTSFAGWNSVDQHTTVRPLFFP
jgi:hypothetical protein